MLIISPMTVTISVSSSLLVAKALTRFYGTNILMNTRNIISRPRSTFYPTMLKLSLSHLESGFLRNLRLVLVRLNGSPFTLTKAVNV